MVINSKLINFIICKFVKSKFGINLDIDKLHIEITDRDEDKTCDFIIQAQGSAPKAEIKGLLSSIFAKK